VSRHGAERPDGHDKWACGHGGCWQAAVELVADGGGGRLGGQTDKRRREGGQIEWQRWWAAARGRVAREVVCWMQALRWLRWWAAALVGDGEVAAAWTDGRAAAGKYSG